MAKLLIQNDGDSPASYELIAGTTSIGRHPENTIVLDDPSVSGHHAEIIGSDGNFTLRDSQSSNGTTVN
jgi:pSer/pThr/pTyr-binding forkhead associated (FHA) protein